MNKKIQAALTAGMAAIIGVLAVLGVEGDVLDRFIRDHPQRVAIVLTIAVVGVLMPLMRLGASDAATGKRITRLGPLLPPLLVGLAASLAIWFGCGSFEGSGSSGGMRDLAVGVA